MPVRLEAPLSNGAAYLKADFEGSLRNYYFQRLKFNARRALTASTRRASLCHAVFHPPHPVGG